MPNTITGTVPSVVSPQEWQREYEKMLIKEKASMRARDALIAERRRMPRMLVEKTYNFEGAGGPLSLLDLFAGRRQLIIYRAFFEPGVHGWPDHACVGCSLGADQVSHPAHLNARDTTLVYASRASQADIARLKSRMGWEHVSWVSLTDSFDADFGVDEWHGHNAFIRDSSKVYRSYFINGRGDESMGTVWSYLDMTALGRQEEGEDSPPQDFHKRRATNGGAGTTAICPARQSILPGTKFPRRARRLSEEKAIVEEPRGIAARLFLGET
jgi:predicted dithiol-disulfide oxidoreductase (DUF899 family)